MNHRAPLIPLGCSLHTTQKSRVVGRYQDEKNGLLEILFFEFRKFPFRNHYIPCTIYMQNNDGEYQGFAEFCGNGKYKMNSFPTTELKQVIEEYKKQGDLTRYGLLDSTGAKREISFVL